MARAFKCDKCGKLVDLAVTHFNEDTPGKVEQPTVVATISFHIIPAWMRHEESSQALEDSGLVPAELCAACQIDVAGNLAATMTNRLRNK